MEQQAAQPSTMYKTFGIISLVLGILAFLFSFIPCLGMYAVFPGILGIVMGVIAFIMAGKVNGAKGMIIAGLILSLLGTGVAAWQYNKLKTTIKELDKVIKDTSKMNDLKRSMDSLGQEVDKSLDTANSK